jgi:hypothetical protein
MTLENPNKTAECQETPGCALTRPISTEQFKSRNGDTLAALSERQESINAHLKVAREDLRLAELKLQPLRDIVSEAEAVRCNIDTRLNIWWFEFRQANRTWV